MHQWRHHQKKNTSKAKEVTPVVNEVDVHRSPKKTIPEPIKVQDPSKFRNRRKSESSVEGLLEDLGTPLRDIGNPLKEQAHPTKVLSSTALDTAPVMGKINSRIPEDANVNEYTAVFGSRPKVARTPDQVVGNKQKSTVFMF